MIKVSSKETTTNNNRKTIGDRAEALANQYLIRQGLKFHRANERLFKNEIDLIFKDKDSWVLVEVRYRKNVEGATGLDSITGKKLQFMKKTALNFQKHPLYQQDPAGIRIDIISISGNLRSANIHWIPNAISFD